MIEISSRIYHFDEEKKRKKDEESKCNTPLCREEPFEETGANARRGRRGRKKEESRERERERERERDCVHATHIAAGACRFVCFGCSCGILR
jgi:hypothetical protein